VQNSPFFVAKNFEIFCAVIHNAGILQQENTFFLTSQHINFLYGTVDSVSPTLPYCTYIFFLSVVDFWLSGVPFGGSCFLLVVD
jgi:hypothetical protein